MTRKFGIEIEAVGLTMDKVVEVLIARGIRAAVDGYNHTTKTYWKVVADASLQGSQCFELVSPILEGERGLMEVAIVADALEAAGAKVNGSCGFHVHVDGRDLNVDQLKRVSKMWLKYENCFDALVGASRRQNRYCKSVASKFVTLDQGFKTIDSARDLRQLICAVNGDGPTSGHSSRYHKLNLESMLRHGTVEFRQHGGTVNGEKMVNWIKLVIGFVVAGAEAKTIRTTGAGKFANLMVICPDAYTRKFLTKRQKHFAEQDVAQGRMAVAV
jgi:hypothetical protein